MQYRHNNKFCSGLNSPMTAKTLHKVMQSDYKVISSLICALRNVKSTYSGSLMREAAQSNSYKSHLASKGSSDCILIA